jgi:MFS family permease
MKPRTGGRVSARRFASVRRQGATAAGSGATQVCAGAVPAAVATAGTEMAPIVPTTPAAERALPAEAAEPPKQPNEAETIEGMPPFERKMMMQHRYSWFFWEVAHQSHTACRVTRLLELCNGDATLMMSWYGLVQSTNNLLSVFISPLIGSLSDTYGRKYIVAAGRMGTALFFLSTWFAKSMRQQAILNILSWGVLMPGNVATQLAMSDDLWGSRPKLSSLISAANAVPQNILGVVSPMVGAWINVKCFWLGFWGPFGLMVATSLLWITGPETLPAEKRKPFRVATANPFAAIKLLLVNGPGLRRLSLAAACFYSVVPGT